MQKIVGENIYLEKEQSECRVEKGEMQVATGPEAMNTTIEANVETAEGERFLESSSGVEVSCTDTAIYKGLLSSISILGSFIPQ